MELKLKIADSADQNLGFTKERTENLAEVTRKVFKMLYEAQSIGPEAFNLAMHEAMKAFGTWAETPEELAGAFYNLGMALGVQMGENKAKKSERISKLEDLINTLSKGLEEDE